VADRFGLSWWDGLIVAAARVAGCGYLLTEDLRHGSELNGLRVVDPFQITPDTLPG
jgi:predicted nucleic acid-binding protein